MVDAIDLINVKMMSGFDVSYKGEAVKLEGGADSVEAQLLAALLCYGEEGLSAERMLDMLYYDDKDKTIDDICKLMGRLRGELARSVLPKGDYIIENNGVYRFGGGLAAESDAGAFRSMYRLADECEEEERLGAFLESCCALYGGELLPQWSQRRWVTYENAAILNMYTDAVRQLCVFYQRNHQYKNLVELCERASVFLPFDEEWHVNRINALLAMGEYRRALNEYESVTSMLFDEMGVYPSERLMDCVRAISSTNVFSAPETEDASEGTSAGAYYCSYPAFIDGYKVMKRVMERDGVSSCLLLCTMTDKKGAPLEDHTRLAIAAQMLRYALSRTLRKSDMYTRYSASQMLVMLWGTEPENTGLIEERIRALLDVQRQSAIDAQISFSVLDGDSSCRLQVRGAQKKWKKIRARAEG